MAKVAGIPLSPLLSTNARRVSDRVLGGTVMRGGYNVEMRDNEWWVRKGQRLVLARLGTTPWWWIMDVNAQLGVIANANYALAYDYNTNKVEELYTPAVTESVTFVNGSASATSTTTRVIGQLILRAASGRTDAVYRVTNVSGATVTLDRAYEGSNESVQCRFLDQLARTTAGATTSISGMTDRVGSCVVFEQLVTTAATTIHAAQPATTAGHSYLIITSARGCPVAIDLTAYLDGSVVGVLRTWLYNTALAAPTILGSDATTYTRLAPRGVYAEVYDGRLLISYVTDPSGKYGDRTVYASQRGDFLRWHLGIAGQTAAPNFTTFDGEGDEIAEMKTMGSDLVVHRWFSQEVGSATQSVQTPIVYRSNRQQLGVHDRYAMTNRVVPVNNLHYIWTRNGPAVFDGQRVQLIARDIYRDLVTAEVLDGQADVVAVLNDRRRRRIYWMLSASSNSRHQDALPAGSTYQPVLVYDYDADEAWLEDHPKWAGGGFATPGNITVGSVVPEAMISRSDGSLLTLAGRTTAKDADVTDPTNGTAVTVNAQVETGWLDFGTMERKQLTRVLVVLRSLATGAFWDRTTDLSAGTYGLRLRVYTDWDESTARSDFWQSYSSAAAQLSDRAESRQAPPFSLIFSTNARGMAFKFRFSNALTATASAASHIQVPFRIVDIIPFYVQQESIDPLTTLSGTAYSE